MSDATARAFLSKSRRILNEEQRPRIGRCVAQLDEAQLWWRPNEASNAVGNLLMHLRGNVAEWIVGGVGGRPFERDRPREFAERGPRPAAELLAELDATLTEATAVLDDLTPDDLTERRVVMGRDVSVLEAVYHTVEHFGMHAGQIVQITKALRGEAFDPGS